MKTEVLLERVDGNRYRATGSGRFAVSVEGMSREEALSNFQKAAAAIISHQSEVVTVDVPLDKSDIPINDSWAWFAGRLKDEPLFEEYEAQIERNRQIDDENEARKLQQ